MADACTPLPRERLGIFALEAELCPDVLGRILGVVSATEVVAFTIHVRRYPQIQKIELETNANGAALLAILHRLRRLPMVRHARLASLAERHAAAVTRSAKI